MSENNDLTHLLERLEAFEDKFDLRLSALSAFIGEFTTEVWVGGELHPREGMQLKQPIFLSVDSYDAAGRFVGGSGLHLKPEQVYGYYPFSVVFCPRVAVADLAKIRIFPMPWKPKPGE